MVIQATAKETEIIMRAIKTYGDKSQEDIAIEEMSELTKAILKNRRYSSLETRENIREEIADVLIMLAQLITIYAVPGEDVISDTITEKLDRLKRRLEAENCEINQHIEKCEDCGFCETKERTENENQI